MAYFGVILGLSTYTPPLFPPRKQENYTFKKPEVKRYIMTLLGIVQKTKRQMIGKRYKTLCNISKRNKAQDKAQDKA